MGCDISEEQLWSWLDRDAPELEEHLARCPECRERAEKLRAGIDAVANTTSDRDRSLPESIGPYQITGYLGEGGMGVVYEAQQQTPRRRVALKVLKGGSALDEHRVKLFQRETEALARLTHPGIAAIYEAGHTENKRCFYYAMELVDGEPLDVYARDRELSRERRLELFGRICGAVRYAHKHDVIHRDLKPSNILVDADGQPKVLDFGLARITDPKATFITTIAGTGAVGGTLPYMSPEQTRDDGDEIDARSDAYSLGVILYELLTSKLPLDLSRTSLPEAAQAICENTPTRPSMIERTLRGDLDTIVLKALEKEPARRYQSVEELSDDIGRHLRGEPILAKPPSSLYVLRKKLRKHRTGVLATAAVLIAVLLVWGVQEWRHSRALMNTRQSVPRLQRDVEAGGAERALDSITPSRSRFPEVAELHLVFVQAKYRLSHEQSNDVLYNDTLRLLETIQVNVPEWAADALAAEIYREEGDSRAESLTSKLRGNIPNTAEDWYLRSYTTLDLHKAVEYSQRAVDMRADHIPAWQRLAYACLLAGEYERAESAAGHILDLGGNHFHWTTFKAHCLLLGRRFQDAENKYAAIMREHPRHGHVYRGRALARLCLRNYAGAAADLSRCIDFDAEQAEWEYRHRAAPRWMAGNHEGAAEDCRATIPKRPYASYADIRLFLILSDHARLLERDGFAHKTKTPANEATEALEAALDRIREGDWCGNIVLCLRGDITPNELVERANMDKEEIRCEAFYYAGEACLLKDDAEAARSWFEKCVETDILFDQDEYPPDPMTEYHLAVWRLRQLSEESRPAPTPD